MIVYPDPIQGPNTSLAKSFSYEPMPNIPQSQTPQISLRDYFAAAALQGLLAYDGDCSTAIGLAYHTADAMLDWRKKNP